MKYHMTVAVLAVYTVPYTLHIIMIRMTDRCFLLNRLKDTRNLNSIITTCDLNNILTRAVVLRPIITRLTHTTTLLKLFYFERLYIIMCSLYNCVGLMYNNNIMINIIHT